MGKLIHLKGFEPLNIGITFDPYCKSTAIDHMCQTGGRI